MPDLEPFSGKGAYGCVNFPSFDCSRNKKHIKNSELVSKFTVNGFDARNEVHIGKALRRRINEKQIQLVNNPFIFVESSCEVKSRSVLESITQTRNCKDIYEKLSNKKGKSKSKYVLLYSKYYPHITASELIKRYSDDYRSVLFVYLFCWEHISYLYDMNIVHMDLHLGNVICERDNQHVLHIIDYGMAFDKDKWINEHGHIDYDYLENIFCVHDASWRGYTLELHILEYLIYNNAKITSTVIRDIVDKYYKEQISQEEKQVIVDFYSNWYGGMNNEDCIKEIINKMSGTWDLYRVSYILRSYLRNIETATMDEIDRSLYNKLMVILNENTSYDYRERNNNKHHSELMDIILLKEDSADNNDNQQWFVTVVERMARKLDENMLTK